MILIKKIKKWCSETPCDEDGNLLKIQLAEGLSDFDIQKMKTQNGINLPKELEELLIFTNGMNFFDQQILSIEEMQFYSEKGLLSFHTWGNGDFDCISTGKHFPLGSIIFMSHSESNLTFVTSNLSEWFDNVYIEIADIGTLLHPLDYNNRNYKGSYQNVFITRN